MNVLDQLKDKIRTMPPFPAICARILSKLQDPDADLHAIAATIQYDPGITANILHLANSAYFGLDKPVSSIKEACLLAGTKRIMQLALANGVAGVLNQPLAGYDLGPREMLQHSVWVAIASEEFCAAIKRPAPETLFTAGLLHDIGKIVLNDIVYSQKTMIKKTIKEKGITHPQAELAVLGIDHAQAGALLLHEWKLPALLVEAVRWHHHPEQASAMYSDTANIVHLANVLSTAMGIGMGNTETACHPLRSSMDKIKLTPAIVEKVACQTLEKMQTLEGMLAK